MPFLLFLTSAAIMVIEILASRLVAPAIGSSIYTWTAVIGVIVSGVALGNVIGGRLADKRHPNEVISWALIRAALSIVLVMVVANLAPSWKWLTSLPFQMRVLIHVTLVFIWPALFLGMVSPAIGKKILNSNKVGQSFGRTMGWGSLGAVFGTYFAGFVLIPFFGTQITLWCTGSLLVLLGIAQTPRIKAHWGFGALFFALMAISHIPPLRPAGEMLGLRKPQSKRVVLQDESPYGSFQVVSSSCSDSVRFLRIDGVIHSVSNIEDDTQILARPTRTLIKILGDHFARSGSHRFLNIGGAAQNFSRYAVTHWKKANIDIVEIDPRTTAIAKQYMNMRPHPRISTTHMDGRLFVDQTARKHPSTNYDLILNDAFLGTTMPFQLTTREFVESVRKILSPEGIFVTNMVAAQNRFEFVQQYASTLSAQFRYLKIFPVQQRRFGNYLVVASQSPLDFIEESPLAMAKASSRVFTDDYAPAEYLSRSISFYAY